MTTHFSVTAAAPKPSARAIELDVLRGAGALAVVVLHASAEPLTQESALGQTSWWLLVPNVMARFAVPVFMILSGMGLTLSRQRDQSYAQFLWRRLSSIVPAYVAWSLIYAWLLPKHDAISVRTLLTDLVTGYASSHLYFVPAVLRLYLLYPVMSYLARAVPWGVAGSCLLSWSMIWLSPVLKQTELGRLVSELLPLRWMGYFVLGIALADARMAARAHTPIASSSVLRRARVLAPTVAVASLGCMLVVARQVIEQSADIELALGAAEPLVFTYSVGVLLWATSMSLRHERTVRFLSFVSNHSYAVYLSHMLILQLCVLWLEAAVAESTQLVSFWTGLAVSIPVALATAVLSARATRMCKALWLRGAVALQRSH